METIKELALKQEAIRSGVAISHISEEKIAEIQSVIDGISKDYSGITTAEAVRHLDYANWITGLADDDFQSKIEATAARIAKAERDQKLAAHKILVAKQVEDTTAKAVAAGVVDLAYSDEFKKQIKSVVEAVIIGEELPETTFKSAKDFVADAVDDTLLAVSADKEIHAIENQKHPAVTAAEQEAIMNSINQKIGIITVKVQEIKVLKKQLISPKNQDEVDSSLRAALDNFFIEA
jgi:hypothetical protein